MQHLFNLQLKKLYMLLSHYNTSLLKTKSLVLDPIQFGQHCKMNFKNSPFIFVPMS